MNNYLQFLGSWLRPFDGRISSGSGIDPLKYVQSEIFQLIVYFGRNGIYWRDLWSQSLIFLELFEGRRQQTIE